MKQIQFSFNFEWMPIQKSSLKDDFYYFPRDHKKGTPFISDPHFRRKYQNLPTVYRWIIYHDDKRFKPEETWIYIGETDNLYRRIGNYVNANPTQETNYRLKKIFYSSLSQDYSVRLDNLIFDKTILIQDGVHKSVKKQDDLKDQWLRNLIEAFIILDLKNRKFHPLNQPYFDEKYAQSVFNYKEVKL